MKIEIHTATRTVVEVDRHVGAHTVKRPGVELVVGGLPFWLAADSEAHARGIVVHMSQELGLLHQAEEIGSDTPEASAVQSVPWPTSGPKRYNGSGEPCDMWTGPCICGATHTEGQ